MTIRFEWEETHLGISTTSFKLRCTFLIGDYLYPEILYLYPYPANDNKGG